MKLKYRPWDESLAEANVVVVDGKASAGLHLSHWGGNRTPARFKAPTSAEIVMKYLVSPKRDALLAGATEVTNNHFDEDGLAALWSMIYPERALTRRQEIVAIATTGDFGRYTTAAAFKSVATIAAMHEVDTSPYDYRLRTAKDYPHATEINYEEMLPRFEEIVDYPERFERLWREDWEAFEQAVALFARGRATVEEAPEVALSIVRTPVALDETAVNTYATQNRVLEVVEGGPTAFHYNYDSWVEVPRQPPARIDLEPLMHELNAGEDGEPWEWNGVDRVIARLKYQSAGEPQGGSEAAVAHIRTFLADHADDPALRFTPDMLRF